MQYTNTLPLEVHVVGRCEIAGVPTVVYVRDDKLDQLPAETFDSVFALVKATKPRPKVRGRDDLPSSEDIIAACKVPKDYIQLLEHFDIRAPHGAASARDRKQGKAEYSKRLEAFKARLKHLASRGQLIAPVDGTGAWRAA